MKNKFISVFNFSCFFFKFMPRSTDVMADLRSKKEGGVSIESNTVDIL